MKIAVYNWHWNTAGGGERLAGYVAQTLAADHDVTILTHEQFDPSVLEERLDLDLSRASVQVIPEPGNEYVQDATIGHDLLVNCCYGSDAPSGARRGIYFVLFPGLRADPPMASLNVIEGFHHPEHSPRWGEYRWTSGAGRLRVCASAGAKVPVHLAVGDFRGRSPAPPTDVDVEVDGHVLHRLHIGAARQRPLRVPMAIEGRGLEEPIDIVVRSNTYCPAEVYGDDDYRQLGVMLLSARMGEVASKPPKVSMPPSVLNGATRHDFLESYHQLVSISQYTQHWVRRLWGRESTVLFPPVSQRKAARKKHVILSVARFFDHSRGHSKKQLEMIHAFKKLVSSGLDDWEFHLVGGCSELDLEYLERVRSEAAGAPVTIHPNASGHVLDELFAKASIFWHGTGLGEKEHKTPYRLEHFGISTVEGMSAGCVPVVVGAGGQREIVEHGATGFHAHNERDLVRFTLKLARDDDLRSQMSAQARRRADDFGPERFASKLHELVEATLTGS